MLVLQETLQTSIWGFSPECSPVKWKQTQHPSPSQLYPALVVLFLKNTLRAYLSVFITDWMLTENTGNMHLLSKCENLLSNLINLILKLCSTSYLESLIKKKKKYLWAVLQSPHRTVSQNHFLKHSSTWGLEKNVISSNLLRIYVFLQTAACNS